MTSQDSRILPSPSPSSPRRSYHRTNEPATEEEEEKNYISSSFSQSRPLPSSVSLQASSSPSPYIRTSVKNSSSSSWEVQRQHPSEATVSSTSSSSTFSSKISPEEMRAPSPSSHLSLRRKKDGSFLSSSLICVLLIGIFLRILLYSCLHITLPDSVLSLVSPPTSSFSSFREALTLESLSLSPYTNGVYRQQPFVYFFLKWFTKERTEGKGNPDLQDENCSTKDCQRRYFFFLLFLDVVTTLCLASVAIDGQRRGVYTPQRKISDKRNSGKGSGETSGDVHRQRKDENNEEDKQEKDGRNLLQKKKKEKSIDGQGSEEISSSSIASPTLVAACYLFQPLTVGSLLSLSLTPLPLACFSLALAFSMKAGFLCRWMCLLFHSLALYVGPPQAFLLSLPLAHLMQSSCTFHSHYTSTSTASPTEIRQRSTDLLDVLPSPSKEILPGFLRGCLFFFSSFFIFLLLHLASYLLLVLHDTPHPAQYFDSTVVAIWSVRDLTPNLSNFWYILSLVFERYRTFFTIIFQMHSFFLVVPLFIRMYRYPLAYSQAILSIALLFQPYFSVSDASFIFALLISHWQVIRQKASFVKLILVSIAALCIYPVMTELWLGRNTGNANFAFNMQLTFQIFLGFLIVEWIKAITLDRPFTKPALSSSSFGSVEGEEGPSKP